MSGESGTPEASEWPAEMIEELGRILSGNVDAWDGLYEEADENLTYDERVGYRNRVRILLDAALAFRSGGEPVLVKAMDMPRDWASVFASIERRAEAAEAEVERLTEALRALLLYTMHERECEMVNSRPDRDLNPPCTCGADSARIVARALLVGEPE